MRIRGIVVDENAERIANALVIASRGEQPPAFTTRTDAEGSFTFEAEPDRENNTTIRAYANGLASDRVVHRDDTPGGLSVSIEIVPTFDLFGHVHDDQGNPMHGARVATWGDNHTTTNADGGYRLKGLRPGTHHLHAWRNGSQLQTATITLAGEDQLHNWTLPPASGRWIRFTLSDDSPTDVEVRWHLWCRHPIHMHLEGMFPASREVTLGGLPMEYFLQGFVQADKRYGLQARWANHHLEPDPRPGLIEWQTGLEPAQKGTISGIVLDEHDRPMQELMVHVRGFAVAKEATCKTDADGRFHCQVLLRPEELAENDIVFSIADKERVVDDRGEAWSNPRCRNEAYMPLTSEEIVLRTIPAANVRGRVQRGGLPLAEVAATLHVHWTTDSGPFTSRIETTATDAEGNFSFAGLHPETGDGLFVRIVGTGVDCVSETFELNKTTAIVLGDIEAEPLATVRGRLVTASGDADGNTRLILTDQRPERNDVTHYGTDSRADGLFVIRDVRPGTYNLVAYRDLREDDPPPIVLARDIVVTADQSLDLGNVRT